jgi:hypothetical protein
MADTPISGLVAYATVHPQDLTVVVDTTNTSMASTGTDSKATIGQLLGAITGDVAISGLAATVTKTNGTEFAPSATTDTTNAANIASGTLAAARLPALTGVVQATAGSATTSYAPIAPITILANPESEDLAPLPTPLSAFIDAAIGDTQGGILYRNATDWVQLAPGTSGQFLETLGAGENLQWGTPSGSGGGSSLTPTAVQTANFTASAGQLALFNTTGGALTGTLPTAPAVGTQVGVMTVAGGSPNSLSVATGGSDVFNVASGPTTTVLPYKGQMMIWQYGTGGIWYTIASYTGSNDVGDFATATLALGSAITLTTGTAANITSLSLPANSDWDVWGVAVITSASAVTLGRCISVIATTSAGTGTNDQENVSFPSSTDGSLATFPVPATRFLVTTATTVFLNVSIGFSGGAANAWGTIYARRWR